MSPPPLIGHIVFVSALDEVFWCELATILRADGRGGLSLANVASRPRFDAIHGGTICHIP